MKITKEIKEKMLELKANGKNLQQIADIFGCNKKTARYHLSENNKKCTVRASTERKKQKVVDIKNLRGGKCQNCNYNKCFGALEFHHINPLEKEFGVSKTKGLSPIKLVEEINKCLLLCANCHREFHAGVLDINHLQVPIITTEELNNYLSFRLQRGLINAEQNRPKREKAKYYCSCGELKSDKRSKDCQKCHGMGKIIKIPISKEELSKIVWEKPIPQIAKDLNVCVMTVDKWCNELDINKPGRGFWSSKAGRKI